MTTASLKRRLAAIMSADVKDYSVLMRQDEAATVQTLTAYRTVMSELIGEPPFSSDIRSVDETIPTGSPSVFTTGIALTLFFPIMSRTTISAPVTACRRPKCRKPWPWPRKKKV